MINQARAVSHCSIRSSLGMHKGVLFYLDSKCSCISSLQGLGSGRGIMNDANLQACSPRTGLGNGFLPSSFRAIVRSASTLVSTVRSAGSSVASTITLTDEDRQCEQVQWAGFDKLELAPDNVRQVLLLSYANGFQVWDVENADEVWEIVSKRDGPVVFLRVQPQPTGKSGGKLKLARPLLLVVTADASNCRSNGAFTNSYSAAIASPSVAENPNAPTLVKFYSLQSHSYVHTLRFCTAILAVRCSPQVVAIALATQLYCFNAATLERTISVPTYPSPQLGSNRLSFGHGALAVGPRWLAYAANQPIISNTGRVSPQHLTFSPGVSPSTSPANGSLVAHYAKESSKQLAAGIVTLGDKGYKALSRYCTEGVGSPVSGSQFVKGSCGHTEHAGTVIVCDFVTKLVVSQFRAHESPLSALSFDGTGTLLVTASIHGHTINIFRILPVPNVNNINASSYDTNSSHAHLYKLYRGMTNAVIQDIAFSADSHWIVVSSSRGTHHLFAISPFGGAVGPSTHGAGLADCALGSMQSLPWWSNRGPLTSSQYVSGPLPATVSLSVVSRIKIGSGGWCCTMSGAAVSGRSCCSFGAVAVVFHDGRGRKLDAEGGQNTLKEQLWVLSPFGHLIRHALHLSAGTGGHSNTISSPIVAGLQKEAFDLKMAVEPLQKWDLCRRLNWVEREENVNIPNVLNAAHDGAGSSTHSTTIKAGLSKNQVTLGKLDTFLKETTNKQMHQWFLSNAEVHMHHLRPPIWASSQISFHVLSEPAFNKVLWEDVSCGEYEIEKVISRVVEVKKKDLVPVFDMFRNYQLGEDNSLARDASYLPKGQLNPLNLQSGMKFGFSTDVGGSQSQYSSSGSSCGLEGSLCSGLNVGFSNGHHPCEEDHSLDLQFQPMNTLLAHESHQHFHAESSRLQNTHSPSTHLFESKKGVTAPSLCFPSLDIPGQSNGDAVDSKAGEKPGVKCSDMLHEGGRVRSQAVNLEKTSESRPTSTNKNFKKFDLQDYEVATDVESTDGNSKSEDFGGEQGDDGSEGEHGEDGWEGALFPFVEDC